MGHFARLELLYPLRGNLLEAERTGGIALLIPRLHAAAPSGRDT
jgi:hypothetical protein